MISRSFRAIDIGIDKFKLDEGSRVEQMMNNTKIT